MICQRGGVVACKAMVGMGRVFIIARGAINGFIKAVYGEIAEAVNAELFGHSCHIVFGCEEFTG